MKIRFLFLIYMFFFIRAFCQTPADRVDALMKSVFLPGDPGAVIGIFHQQQIVLEKGYGVADLSTGSAITPEDNFNLGSLTKQFTGYSMLHMYYHGKFAMSDSIGAYLALPPPISSLRIGQLLNHNSGIPDHYALTDTNTIKHATDEDVFFALKKGAPLNFRAGSRYRYSNTAYCLLGVLISKLSGLSYADYLSRNIFVPLEIKDASVYRAGRPIYQQVIGYQALPDGHFKKSDADESVFFSTEADGGVYISMKQYLKWCSAIEYGKLSASKEIIKSWQGQTPVDSAHNLWYGYGWFIQRPDEANSPKIIYHTGSNGGFRTVVMIIPSLEYCISIFSNRTDIDLEDLVARINRILSINDNSFIKSAPLESFIHTWPIFAPCKETSLFSTSSIRNLNASDMALNSSLQKILLPCR